MQPHKLDYLYSQHDLGEGGLLPRVMACQIEAEPTKADLGVIPPDIKDNWRQLLHDLIEDYRFWREEPFVLTPTDKAAAIFRIHHDNVVDRRYGDLVDVQIYAARWPEWTWRLAVVLHAGKYGAQAHLHRVNSETAEAAIRLTDWFAERQLEILAKSRGVARREKEKAVLDLFLHQPARKPKTTPSNSITAREVQQAHIVYSSAEAHALLKQMEAEGKLFSEESQALRGGHRVQCYFRNV
jgi:hypothetical protein